MLKHYSRALGRLPDPTGQRRGKNHCRAVAEQGRDASGREMV
jgi:hypothetical protein